MHYDRIWRNCRGFLFGFWESSFPESRKSRWAGQKREMAVPATFLGRAQAKPWLLSGCVPFIPILWDLAFGVGEERVRSCGYVWVRWWGRTRAHRVLPDSKILKESPQFVLVQKGSGPFHELVATGTELWVYCPGA